MAKSQTFLQLAPEFGGTKFGPFDQVEIRLGSDPGNSDITLPEALGVAPQHLKLLKQQDDSYILAPVERTAAVYHFRAGSPRPKQVLAPTAIASGDGFALVTPEGPRFAVLVEKNAAQIAKSVAESQGPKFPLNFNPNNRWTRGLWNEVKRRGFAAVFTTRLGNLFMRMSMMVRSGAIFSPVYVVSGILLMSGWLFTGGSSCSLYRMSKQRNQVQAKLQTCQDQLGVSASGEGDDGDPTVQDLTKVVLEDPEWKGTMDADADLYAAYTKALREVFSTPEKYKWVYTKKASPYTAFKGALTATGMPDALVRSLAFAAAGPQSERPFAIVQDSEGAEVCGRGPLGLTYRQAYQLGMTLQPDGLADRSLAESQDLAAMRSLLDATTKSAGATVTYRDDLVQTTGAELQGGMACVYVDGEDDRTDPNKIARALQQNLGASVTKKLPSEGSAFWISSRLVMLYAFDMKAHALEEVAFDATKSPSMQLSTRNVKKERISFAIESAGRVMARAAAVPCIARFDREKKNAFPDWFLKNEPRIGSCAILKAYVEYDAL
jgi:hypothetical protein